MKRIRFDRVILGSLATLLTAASSAWAASPTAEQALKLAPIQRNNIEYDIPEPSEVARCSIAAKKINDHVGWVVTDPAGVTLRNFVDTNDDNVVDQWSYYKDGLEVYRDIDADFNGKADQHRWFHTAGSRWGVDKDEDGTIDTWKMISPEEVTAEVVAALATQDMERFARVALRADEVRQLGLGRTKTSQLNDKIAALPAGFQQAATGSNGIRRDTEWLQFSGNRPGIVPAGTDGSTQDLRVYENVMAIIEVAGEHREVVIGTLIQVGSVWRVIDVPQPTAGGETQLASMGFFFRGRTLEQGPTTTTGPNERTQALLTELEKLDAAAEQATSPSDQAKYNAQRATLLEQIAQQSSNPDDRAMWIRQLADMVSAAVQSGGYADGTKRLEELFEKLKSNPGDRQLEAYVRFRLLTSEYSSSIQNASTSEFVKIQEGWLDKLEQYAKAYPDSPDAAEALLQLGIAQEFAGEEEEAQRWYAQVAADFPNSSQAVKASGASRRLDSVGKTISLRGQAPDGKLVDLAAFRGKVVLIQYWATWCEPCKADMAAIKELYGKHGSSAFAVIGVNVDSNLQEMANYLAQNRLPWPQIREEGGLDSRPANEMGILTLPTMILVDQQGAVVNRNVNVDELDRELAKLIP